MAANPKRSTSKILGLGYPGGPALAHLATKGVQGRFDFPRPMIDRPGLDFSFSGLKTSVLTTWRTQPHTEQIRADIARAFEEAVIDTLAIKCRRALQETGLKTLVVAGGVGANQRLRLYLSQLADKIGIKVYYPRPIFCTDNGAMIAYAGALRLASGQCEPLRFTAHPRWPMSELNKY